MQAYLVYFLVFSFNNIICLLVLLVYDVIRLVVKMAISPISEIKQPWEICPQATIVTYPYAISDKLRTEQ